MELLVFLAFFALMFKLFILALIVGAVVFMLKRGRFGKPWGRNGKRQFSRLVGEDNALQIARKRFAGGEISREEYESLKRALTSSSQTMIR